MPETIYSYIISTDFLGSMVGTDKLGADIQASSITTALTRIDTVGDNLDIVFASALSTADKTTLDGDIAGPAGGLIDTHALAESKRVKNFAIDKRTQELIAEGFTYSSKIFSLSGNAQKYWNGLSGLVANSLLVEPTDFPITINTLDDLDTYDIVDIADVKSVFDAAAEKIKEHLSSGTSLKDSVRAATDIAGVDAVTDTR